MGVRTFSWEYFVNFFVFGFIFGELLIMIFFWVVNEILVFSVFGYYVSFILNVRLIVNNRNDGEFDVDAGNCFGCFS